MTPFISNTCPESTTRPAGRPRIGLRVPFALAALLLGLVGGCRYAKSSARQAASRAAAARRHRALRDCRHQPPVERCTDVFVRRACRQAFQRATGSAVQSYRATLEACRRDYCPHLRGPRPALCGHHPDREPIAQWFSLQPEFALAVGRADGAQGKDLAAYEHAFALLQRLHAFSRARRTLAHVPPVRLRLLGRADQVEITATGPVSGTWRVSLPAPLSAFRPFIARLAPLSPATRIHLKLDGVLRVSTYNQLLRALSWAGIEARTRIVDDSRGVLVCRGDPPRPSALRMTRYADMGFALNATLRGDGLWSRGVQLAPLVEGRVQPKDLQDGPDGWLVRPLIAHLRNRIVVHLNLRLGGLGPWPVRTVLRVVHSARAATAKTQGAPNGPEGLTFVHLVCNRTDRR